MRSAPARAWHELLRDLRRAAGISQEGWATRLEYGRRTIQRWENGTQPPSADAAVAIIELCRELSLFRTYRTGSLAGSTIDAAMLEVLLAEARLENAGTAREGVRRTEPAARAHNLPRPLTALVGRDWEVAELAKLLRSSALVTITGTGGVGKTRLALAIAWDSLPAFADGAWLVSLGDIRDPSLVSIALGQALRIRESPGRGVTEPILRSLRERRLLLFLDNCEHVRDAVASLAAEILAACPDIHVLATSRERLGLPGEITWPLAPLVTPSDAPSWTADEITASDAVRLFVERATEARPGFRMTDANAPAVARIVRRLDGLPLAIELAAARAPLLTPAELEIHLRDRLELLSSSGTAVPARQRTLAAALDWSWELLADEERRLLPQLSIFVDGWSLEALAGVCPDASLPTFARLVDVSLVAARPDERIAGTRYRLLETVRAYAAAKLEPGSIDVLHERLARWCLETARVAASALHGADQGRWLTWVEVEHGTIRSVMSRALEATDIATATRLIGALWWAWGVLGRGAEARAWTEQALALVRATASGPTDAVARTLIAAAGFASFAGDVAAAQTRLDEAESAARASDDPGLMALVGSQRTRLLEVTGRFEEAAALASEVSKWAARTGDGWTSGRMLEVRAHAALRRGQPHEALSYLREAERLERLDGDVWGIATVLAELGDLDRAEGQVERARERYEESLALRERLGIPGSTPSLVQNLGFVALATGDVDGAAERFRTAAHEFRRGGDGRGIAECVVGLAGVAAARARPTEAAQLLGWARHALESSGGEIWPSNRGDHARIERVARDALAEAGWRRAREDGAQMSLEDVLNVAARPAAAGAVSA